MHPPAAHSERASPPVLHRRTSTPVPTGPSTSRQARQLRLAMVDLKQRRRVERTQIRSQAAVAADRRQAASEADSRSAASRKAREIPWRPIAGQARNGLRSVARCWRQASERGRASLTIADEARRAPRRERRAGAQITRRVRVRQAAGWWASLGGGVAGCGWLGALMQSAFAWLVHALLRCGREASTLARRTPLDTTRDERRTRGTDGGAGRVYCCLSSCVWWWSVCRVVLCHGWSRRSSARRSSLFSLRFAHRSARSPLFSPLRRAASLVVVEAGERQVRPNAKRRRIRHQIGRGRR
jgi:hypothetical protein